jgi:hypothetical protein
MEPAANTNGATGAPPLMRWIAGSIAEQHFLSREAALETLKYCYTLQICLETRSEFTYVFGFRPQLKFLPSESSYF